jgi:hypothetical protein
MISGQMRRAAALMCSGVAMVSRQRITHSHGQWYRGSPPAKKSRSA